MLVKNMKLTKFVSQINTLEQQRIMFFCAKKAVSLRRESYGKESRCQIFKFRSTES